MMRAILLAFSGLLLCAAPDGGVQPATAERAAVQPAERAAPGGGVQPATTERAPVQPVERQERKVTLRMTPAGGDAKVEVAEADFGDHLVLFFISPLWETEDDEAAGKPPVSLKFEFVLRFDKETGAVEPIQSVGQAQPGGVGEQGSVASLGVSCVGGGLSGCCMACSDTKCCLFCWSCTDTVNGRVCTYSSQCFEMAK